MFQKPAMALMLCLLCLGAPDFGTRANADTASTATATGTVTGRVTYRSDSSRPWRYARYYVRNAKDGFLAEAVVALRGRELKRLSTSLPESPVVIDQQNFQFVPETVAIRAGESVKFTNSDTELHNVKTSDGAQPFSMNLPRDGQEVRNFRHAGGTRRPLRLGCAFHGAMRGWIFVFDHPCFQVTGSNGRFRIEGVPPGKYQLEMVHPAGDLAWQQMMEVTAGKTTEIEIEVSPDDVRSKTSQ